MGMSDREQRAVSIFADVDIKADGSKIVGKYTRKYVVTK